MLKQILWRLMLKRILPNVDTAYALLRIVAGLMFSFHGMQKIFGILTDHQPEIGSQGWIGGLIELTCGLIIAIGFSFTRWAAFLASGTMAVAYIQFHWKGQLGSEAIPTINRGELALLYAFVFLLISACGAGPASLSKGRG